MSEEHKQSVAEEIDALCAQISYHSARYHNANTPEISDAAYDALMQNLRALEAENPTLVREDSPTQRVGGDAIRSVGVLVAHRNPMLSMQDVFSREEVEAFVESCFSKLGDEISFVVETKIDGLSLALRYEKGKLVTAITRGDGHNFGEEVTANARAIADIPQRLKTSPAPDFLELRGEVYMTNAAFLQVNARQELLEKRPFANPRNCAAGTLRQLDSKVTRERALSFFAFNIQEMTGQTPATQAEVYAYLRALGVTAIDQYFVCHSALDVWQAIEAIGNLRATLPYEIDGAVVKLNALSLRAALRDTAKNAGYQVAYKYPPEQKETLLLDIELSVGRTGKITPTAVLEPIRLCGTSVARASLHNQDTIDKLGICIGSTLLIEKSGEVIPKCVGEIAAKRPAGAQVFQIPPYCPVCGSEAKREEDGADIRCQNLACPAQLDRLLRYFVGRDAMDLKGFGDAYIHELIEAGYLRDVADVFTLHEHREALIDAGIIGKATNTDKLLAVIEAAKSNPPARLLTGLGISNVGRGAARQLMDYFGSFDALAAASFEELCHVPDIGPTTASCLLAYLKSADFALLLDKFKAAGLTLAQELKRAPREGLPFSGKSFVITGTLPSTTREAAAALIEENGGSVKSAVSKKTSYLLAGEEAGSKLAKARSLGVPILSWGALRSLLDAAKKTADTI